MRYLSSLCTTELLLHENTPVFPSLPVSRSHALDVASLNSMNPKPFEDTTMRSTILALTLLIAAPTFAQPSVVSDPELQEGVSLTIYNQGFAVVREVRPISLHQGMNRVRIEGVAAQIDPTSISIQSLDHPGSLSVREQNYQFDLIGTNSVLDKAVGQRVRLIRETPNGTEIDTGILLSQPAQGRIIQLDDGRVLVNPGGTIELMSMPEGLLSRPSLLWHLNTSRGGSHRAEVAYMTNGITWSADYVAVINEDETEVNMTGWVTLNNQSGATYRNATLQLLAGDVRRVQEGYYPPPPPTPMAEVLSQDAAPAFQEESFFEYHLYNLSGTTTIAERETKQMELLGASGVGVNRRLVFDGSGTYFPFYRARRPGAGGATEEMNAAIVIELENSEANSMGMPLPKGKVRVYKRDSRGNLQFLGEDLIDHTPRNETIDLYIGDAFDVVGTRRQTSNRTISRCVSEQSYEIQVRNRKETAVEVDVVERVWGDWTITQESHSHSDLDSRTIKFPIHLAHDATEEVTYTIRFRGC